MRYLIISLLFGVTSYAQTVTAPDAELKLLSKEFSFTEGPIADSNGDVYFTDQPNDRIVKYSFADGEFTDWLKPAGRSNGLYFLPPNRLIACADADNELWEINLDDKSHKIIAKDNFGGRFNGPNDCWANANGAIYFTDPLYKRPYWTQKISDDSPRGVYRRSPDGKLKKVAEGFKQPNGIIGDAERQTLYVADIGGKKIYQFRIREDGGLTDRKLFCESGSDGMTIDENRNIYLTGSEGVTVYNPAGKLIETIKVRRGWTANVTFAGPQSDYLFITAGNSVFTIKMSVRGLPRAEQR